MLLPLEAVEDMSQYLQAMVGIKIEKEFTIFVITRIFYVTLSHFFCSLMKHKSLRTDLNNALKMTFVQFNAQLKFLLLNQPTLSS